jgi:hypothetical protein
MKDITSVSSLKKLHLFDVENPCKYYKLVYEPELVLLNTIDIDNYNSVQYTVSNYTVTIGWNMWTKMFKLSVFQNEELLRTVEFGVGSDTGMIYNPEFNGSAFKLVLLFDLKSPKRPLYIFRTYDVMEAY